MSNKCLIIGSEGFVGQYLKEKYQNIDSFLFSDIFDINEKNYYKMDITDLNNVKEIIGKIKPKIIFYLASQSSVKRSIDNPQQTFKINVEGLLNVLETIKKLNFKPYFIFISSIEVYDANKGKINEKTPYLCNNPYAISKCTGEEIIAYYKELGVIDGIIIQPVPHIGPKQKDTFSISSFAKQIALLEKSNQNKLYVGNLDIERDILDVRDVISFYDKIIKEKPNNFNKVIIGSGKTYHYRELVEKLIQFSNKKNIEIVIDKDRLRPVNTKIISVNISYVLSKFLWKSTIPMEKTLLDILNYWRAHI